MPQLDDKVAQVSGGQPSRVAAQGGSSAQQLAGQDLIAQLVDIQGQQAGLAKERAQLPTLGDQLTSLPGIMSLLAGGAAAATGGQEGIDAGAGLIGGFMQGAQQQTLQSEAAIASAQAQTQKILDANRQRLSTMITSRPELFIDPDTGQSAIDPRLLGYASTGFLIPVDPGASSHLAKQTATQKLSVDVGSKLLLQGDTPEKRRQGGVMLSNALGLGLDEDFFGAIMEQNEAEQWSTLLARSSIDPNATLRAWTFATQNGRTMADPEVIGMLRGAKAPSGGKVTIQDKVLSLVGEFDQIMATTENALHNAPLTDQLEFAFSGREGDLATMKKHFLGTDAFGTGISGGQMLNSLNSTTQMLNTMLIFAPQSKFLKTLGIEKSEDIPTAVGSLMDSSVAYIQEAQAAETSAAIGFNIRELTTFYEKAGEGMSFGDATNTAYVTAKQLRQKHTTAGRLDPQAFQADVNKILLGE